MSETNRFFELTEDADMDVGKVREHQGSMHYSALAHPRARTTCIYVGVVVGRLVTV